MTDDAVKNVSTEKSRQPLKFKVEGGLDKISTLYETMDADPGALDICWEKPHSYLKGFIDAENISLSKGYKQLADAMSSLDLRDICKGRGREQIDALQAAKDQSVSGLLAALAAHDGKVEFRRGELSEAFPVSVAVAVAVVAVAVAVSTTSLSGVSNEISRTPAPGAPTLGMLHAMRVSKMVSHARAVADQLGWYEGH